MQKMTLKSWMSPNLWFCINAFVMIVDCELSNVSMNSRETDKVCKEQFRCPNYYDTQLVGIKYGVPGCYCDSLCTRYHDCCKLKAQSKNSKFKIQNLREDQDPIRFSTCLSIGEDDIGFWVVNRCGSHGSLCSNNTTLSHLVTNLPVTDANDLTYLNEECAKCNNVRDYKMWNIYVELHQTPSRKEAMVDLDELQKRNYDNFIRDGRVYLSPPKDISIRVCYKFKWVNISDEISCPDHQAPVTQMINDKEVAGIYKNVECCKRAGKCIPQEEYACENRIYTQIKIFYSSSIQYRAFHHTPGVLLQFNEKCSVNKRGCTDFCKGSGKQCHGRSPRMTNFPLLEGHTLRLVLAESHHALADPLELFLPFIAFLWTSKWKIETQVAATISINLGQDCQGKDDQCIVLETSNILTSLQGLSASDIKDLKSWTKHINFKIHYKTSNESFTAYGSLSQKNNATVDCTCKVHRKLTRYTYHFFYYPPGLYKVTFQKNVYRCADFDIYCNEYLKTIEVICKESIRSNSCVSSVNPFGVFGSAMCLVRLVMSCLS